MVIILLQVINEVLGLSDKLFLRRNHFIVLSNNLILHFNYKVFFSASITLRDSRGDFALLSCE